LAAILRSAGFLVVTLYDEYGESESRIADPVIIYDCGFKNRVLLTGDQDLAYTWAKEIIEARIAVFITTDNNDGPKQWGPRIVSAKDEMIRELSRRPKPFIARISKDGCLTMVRVLEGSAWKTIHIPRKKPSKSRKD